MFLPDGQFVADLLCTLGLCLSVICMCACETTLAAK